MKKFLFVTEEDEGFVGSTINISQYQQIPLINIFFCNPKEFEICKFYQDSKDAEVKKVFKNPVSKWETQSE